MPLYNKLKEYRAKLGVNQQEMGVLVQTSRQTISQIERGDYSPSVTLALKIAKVCGVSVEDIFQYEDDKKVNKKSNLKIYIIFAVMILASLLGGFLAGRLAAVNKDTLDGINWDHIWWITADTLPIVYGVLMLATFVVSFVMYGKIKRMIRGWDGEDEAELIMIAKSSKKGFMTGIKAGFVMWILTFMSMFAFDTGVMPIVAVGLVLIVMYVAYCREFVRLQK